MVMNKRKTRVHETDMLTVTEEVIDSAEQAIEKTEAQIEQTVAPIRKSIIKRFPTLFLLTVTLGFTATITGIEQLLIQQQLLQENPLAILLVGLFLLILTGTLYKKLG